MSRRAAQHRARLALLSGQGSFTPIVPIVPLVSVPESPSPSPNKTPTKTKSSTRKTTKFFPPISSQNHLSTDTSSHTVEGIGHFRTRAEARGYNTQHSVRGTKVDRQLNAGIGPTSKKYMSRRQKEKGVSAMPIVSQALAPRVKKKKLILSKPPETVMETRRKKMKKVMLNMLLQARKKGWLQWIEWQTIHASKYGNDARISKVNQLNESILALNRKNATWHDLPGGGLKPGDIVIFTCIEAPVDGDMKPIHSIEPHAISRQLRQLLLIGMVDGGKAAKSSQQRRGHGNEAMVPITFWTRDPKYPLNDYELSIHERFVRKSKT
tara:strand:- start:86 stop:1054 length:969 start_codon:yes stop_codon:yes gene_type:complete